MGVPPPARGHRHPKPELDLPRDPRPWGKISPHEEAGGAPDPSRQRSSALSGAENRARAAGRGRAAWGRPPPRIKATPTMCPCRRALPSRGVRIPLAAVSPPGDVLGSLPLASRGSGRHTLLFRNEIIYFLTVEQYRSIHVHSKGLLKHVLSKNACANCNKKHH